MHCRKQTASSVVQKLRSSPEKEPEPFHISLEGIVEHAEDLFVIGLASLPAGKLVKEVDHLVKTDEQPCEAGKPDE